MYLVSLVSNDRTSGRGIVVAIVAIVTTAIVTIIITTTSISTTTTITIITIVIIIVGEIPSLLKSRLGRESFTFAGLAHFSNSLMRCGRRMKRKRC